MATEVKVGDKVRVLIEGEVDYLGRGYFTVGVLGHGNAVYQEAEHVKSVEVLKQPVKVGDRVTLFEARDLPAGSVVLESNRDPFTITDSGFVGRSGTSYPTFFGNTATVAYIAPK